MIAKLNLASQPFRNRTLPWSVAAAVASASLVALVFIWGAARQAGAEAERVERDVRALRLEAEALREKIEEIKRELPPDQLETLRAAHALVEHKRFSWSRLLADLESSLPRDVRVSRINVRDAARVGGQIRADLDLSVVGRAPDDVTRMISEMNRGGTFVAVPVSENPQTGRGEGGFEWALRVTYVQRSVTRADDEGDAGGESARDDAGAASPRVAASAPVSNDGAEASGR